MTSDAQDSRASRRAPQAGSYSTALAVVFHKPKHLTSCFFDSSGLCYHTRPTRCDPRSAVLRIRPSRSLVNVRQWRGVSPYPETRCTCDQWIRPQEGFPVRMMGLRHMSGRAGDLWLSHRAHSEAWSVCTALAPPHSQTYSPLMKCKLI